MIIVTFVQFFLSRNLPVQTLNKSNNNDVGPIIQAFLLFSSVFGMHHDFVHSPIITQKNKSAFSLSL